MIIKKNTSNKKSHRLKEIRKKIKNTGFKKVLFDIKASTLTSFKTGGEVFCLVIADKREDLEAVINLCIENQIDFTITGDGTNLLVNDGYLEFVFIKLGREFNYLKLIDSCKFMAGSAYNLSRLVLKSYSLGYDFSFLAGIPGTVGGAVIGNSGNSSYGICNFIETLEGFFLRNGKLEKKSLDIKEKDFGYRYLNIPDLIAVTDVLLKSSILDKKLIFKKIKDKIKGKREKQPLDTKNAGCFFRNPENSAKTAGELIEKSGLKGFIYGGARVSFKHANFIENFKNATSEDIFKLSKIVKNIIRENFNISLDYEVKLIGF